MDTGGNSWQRYNCKIELSSLAWSCQDAMRRKNNNPDVKLEVLDEFY